jgi:hypothetical protein
MVQVQETKMGKAPRKSEAAKEQTVRIARMLTASTGITPEGFVVLCRAIMRDSRNDDFQEIYGEAPVLRQSTQTPNHDS